MTQKKQSDSAASGMSALYPVLVVAIILGAAYYFDLLGRFSFGPKTEASKVWLVTYHGDDITGVEGPLEGELAACKSRAEARSELQQHADADSRMRHDCILQDLRPAVTARPS